MITSLMRNSIASGSWLVTVKSRGLPRRGAFVPTMWKDFLASDADWALFAEDDVPHFP